MHNVPDASTADLTQTRVRLADDVIFTPQTYGNENCYHLESGAQWFRIGVVEYTFLSLLDGRKSFCEAFALTARAVGPESLSQQKALALYRWALQQGLTQFDRDDSGTANTRKQNTNPKWWNPFWIRLPITKPDRLLRQFQPLSNWIFSPTATVAGVLIMLAAAIQILFNYEQFSNAATSVFAPQNWAFLVLAWLMLKLIHELAHGMVCQRYGGSVSETGVILAFLVPLPYVDVSSCWAFRNRWKRIHTSIAGMYVELLAASVATFVWMYSESLVAKHLAHNVIIMASLSTILFNANPLMRFDGYYVLSDLLELPNLYADAMSTVRDRCALLLFGIRSSDPVPVGRRRYVLLLYGIAALFWKVLVCASLVIAASVMFHGAGIILSVCGVALWLVAPVAVDLQRVLSEKAMRKIQLFRATLVVSCAGTLVTMAAAWLPVPVAQTAPGIVTMPEGSAIRAEVSGFVQQVHVVDGQRVEKGQLLLELRNDELESSFADLMLQIDQEEIRRHSAIRDHNAAAARVAAGNITSLRQQMAELQNQIHELQVRAPESGLVVRRRIEELINTYVDAGDQILHVDNLRQREFHMSVAQEDFSHLKSVVGKRVNLRIGSRARLSGVLTRIIPRASRRLMYPSLAASAGGMLPVVESADTETVVRKELTEQRFEAVVQINADAALTTVGERGYATVVPRHENLATWLLQESREWMKERLAAAHRASTR